MFTLVLVFCCLLPSQFRFLKEITKCSTVDIQWLCNLLYFCFWSTDYLRWFSIMISFLIILRLSEIPELLNVYWKSLIASIPTKTDCCKNLYSLVRSLLDRRTVTQASWWRRLTPGTLDILGSSPWTRLGSPSRPWTGSWTSPSVRMSQSSR